MGTLPTQNDVKEKYRNTSYSIDSINKQLHKKRLRDDHILQRYSHQWSRIAQSELVADILRGKAMTQIIISEEIKNNFQMNWLIDGVQRCTTLDAYLLDEFAISRNIKHYNIRYQVSKLDDDGKETFNEEGFPELECREFDIRGKKFSQLPEELQEIYRDRQIPVLYNENCTKQDIAEDIARFNRSRPMNKAQSGWLGLEEAFAELAENIIKMPFFQMDFKGSSYTKKNRLSGGLRRIIVESIMVSDFIEDYTKDFTKMCEFLTAEASDTNFTDFYSLVERLTVVCDESVAPLFDLKDSFIWFGLFARFVQLGLDDKKFVEFLAEFSTSEELQTKRVNNITYEELCCNKESGKSRPTKDKNVVTAKLDLLEELMRDYLGLSGEDIHAQENEQTDKEQAIEEFVAECVEDDVESIKEDMDLYADSLEMLLDNTVRLESKLRQEDNRPSLLAMTAYSYKTEEDLDDWLDWYASENNTYFKDQKKNYLYMKDSFHQYIQSKRRLAVG